MYPISLGIYRSKIYNIYILIVLCLYVFNISGLNFTWLLSTPLWNARMQGTLMFKCSLVGFQKYILI